MGCALERLSLWNSYNVAIPLASKTYALDGTSIGEESAGLTLIRFDLSQPGCSRLRQIAHASGHRQENSMLDIIVLALGLGFFAAAIGYTYACERL